MQEESGRAPTHCADTLQAAPNPEDSGNVGVFGDNGDKYKTKGVYGANFSLSFLFRTV